jgi:hypothetical protein
MTDVQGMTDVPAPPYDDADDEPEFQPRPRRRAHVLTFALGAALLIAAGFLGGVLLQKHEDHGSTSAAGNGRARFAALANGTGTATGTATGGTGTGTGTGGTGTAGAGAGGAGTGRGFGGGFGGAGGGGVSGTVKLVDGKNVYVTDTSGNVVKVATNAGSTLTKTDPATTTDVAPGDIVTVRGTPNSDGSYTATSLIIVPAGAASSFGG